MRGHIAKKGKRYYPVVELGRDAQGKRRRKWQGGYATKRDAGVALTELLSSIDKRTYVPNTKQQLNDYLDEWLGATRARVRPSTFESYERNLRLHVLPTLGHLELQKLSGTHLNELYGRLRQGGRRDGAGGLSERTVRYLHTILHRAFGDAVRWNRLARNPADQADPPRKSAATPLLMKTWTASELRSFLEAVEKDRLYSAFHLAATTGMRRGELLGLRWEDIDEDTLSVRQTLLAVGHQIQIGQPKTRRGTRRVNLDPRTVAVVREHRRRQAEERLAFGSLYQDHGLVFAREDGLPLHPESFVKVFDRRVSRAGLRRIRFHDLRHTWATLALIAGVNPKVVSERLGHASISVTLDVYSHALPSMQADAANAVAERIFGAG